jgi:hypothetical protein
MRCTKSPLLGECSRLSHGRPHSRQCQRFLALLLRNLAEAAPTPPGTRAWEPALLRFCPHASRLRDGYLGMTRGAARNDAG